MHTLNTERLVQETYFLQAVENLARVNSGTSLESLPTIRVPLTEHIQAEHAEINDPIPLKKFKKLELIVGSQMIRMLGDYLTEEQKAYLLLPTAVLVHPARLFEIEKMYWENSVPYEEHIALMHEYFFTGYTMSTDLKTVPIEHAYASRETGRLEKPAEIGGAILHTAERQQLIVCSDDTIIKPSLLKLPPHVAQQKQGYTETVDLLLRIFHEKIHALQRLDIPLPLVEIHAYYLQREFLIKKSKTPDVPLGAFSNYINDWNTISQILGREAINRLLFGNLDEQLFLETLTKLKNFFPLSKLARLAIPRTRRLDKNGNMVYSQPAISWKYLERSDLSI